MGMTLAIFHESGKMPTLNDQFKSIEGDFEMDLDQVRFGSGVVLDCIDS